MIVAAKAGETIDKSEKNQLIWTGVEGSVHWNQNNSTGSEFQAFIPHKL